MSSSRRGVREELLAGDDAPAGTVVARGVPVGEVYEEVFEEAPDFPVMWRDRNCLMNAWLCLSVMTMIFCPFGILGALIALIAASLYTCRCCRPKAGKVSGKKTTKIIYIVALLSTVLDLAVAIAMTVLGVLYMTLGCENKTKDICSWRKLLAIILLCSVSVLFVHLFVSFVTFVSMRDCHMELIRYECHIVRTEEEKERKRRKHKRHHHHHHRRRPRPTDAEAGGPKATAPDTGSHTTATAAAGSKATAPAATDGSNAV